MTLRIDQVVKGSFADRNGIRPGDRIVAVNSRAVGDCLDFTYFSADDHGVLHILTREGREVFHSWDREGDGPAGIVTESMLPRSCPNRCIFCFVDQLPPGVRPSLKIRDEDYRFSFLYGNYITLTNLSSRDYHRIGEQRLSPLYISVHTTDDALRRKLLGNPRAPAIIPAIERLATAGIEMHCQIVLCPGENDGPELERTLDDLFHFYPRVGTVAVVPVGLTSHREGLRPMRPIDPPAALETVTRVKSKQSTYVERSGEPFVYLADEWFFSSGAPFPGHGFYGDFPQLENGVGMVRHEGEWFEEIAKILRESGGNPHRKTRRRLLVTGRLVAPLIVRWAKKLADTNRGTWDVSAVDNRFFGDSVTVAGLLTGQDISRALEGRTGSYDLVLLPPDVVNPDGLLLDDLTPGEISRRCRTPVVVAPRNAADWSVL